MATKEELQEKEEDCESTEDYVNLVKEVITDLDDKEWAGELMEEAVDWAETTVTTIGGASHLVLGRYEAATDLVLDFLSDAP